MHKKLTLLLFSASLSIGCAGTSIQRLSKDEFLARAENIYTPTSISWGAYIGVSNERVYLERNQLAFVGSGNMTTVYWTPLAELPAPLVERLKAGNPPWKPIEYDSQSTIVHLGEKP